MKTHNLGYPRIGSKRELKRACEKYWAGKITKEELEETAHQIKIHNWQLQKEAGLDLIPSNDFSFYDQVLDWSLTVGAIPHRFEALAGNKNTDERELYFALARGYQKDGLDITAVEMTKWFDTNYHYLVPEFYKNQEFQLYSTKIIREYKEAQEAGIQTKPVIPGPVSYLLLGKEKEEGFHRLDLLENLLPVYIEVLQQLKEAGVEWVQFDEPFLGLDLEQQAKTALEKAYATIRNQFPDVKILIATYFEGLKDNLNLAANLPIDALHLDLVRAPEQWEEALKVIPEELSLSLGLIDGRNIWKNDYSKSLQVIRQVVEKLGTDRVLLAPSCSLLHVPCDLDLEQKLEAEIKQWLAFAKQKVKEVTDLKIIYSEQQQGTSSDRLKENQAAIASRNASDRIHRKEVKDRVSTISAGDTKRKSAYRIRREAQRQALDIPLFPTTTIGSFPQTKEVRKWRSAFKKGELTAKEYDTLLKQETERVIRWQEEIGLDVLVHGEFERNDMVEYFGERLEGFAFTQYGWVQSYGSRGVKPPIIFGDVYRPKPLTVYWSAYAQSLTDHYVKGMLTGPVTILQWSFVRDDQPRSTTCTQLALAIRDEVIDLEKAGIKLIQIDEPALREGLPLRRADWDNYLEWAVRAFRTAASGVQNKTQIHTHMCYSEFNDIIEHIAGLDADVITIECSRSQMELLDAFAEFKYPNEIGPGVYDIHSPRVPSKEEITHLLRKAGAVIPAEQLWVNPDCGLKTRHWEETEKALKELVEAAREIRKDAAVEV